ncbi:hypothetical protein HII36_53945 [Nonomuraea sp. NN258]|uniref:hypothetical protein n=1 Tax=Nonomuraea antri TaxID=2730852 RepID=UPI0015690C92|nr:hypothetical protein [Nonomuraea antri]NRQ40658.1 hypothetical protein [Nonomuraea antri]
MTAQVSDSVVVDGVRYEVAGIDGGPLFDPETHGIIPIGSNTACWRGYICDYAVESGRFLLAELTLDTQSQVRGLPVGRGTAVFGVHGRRGDWGHVFAPSRLDVPFTGALLLGRDFIDDLYLHMGFHPAWKYEHVAELVLRDGRLIEWRDCSAEIAEIRRAIVAGETRHPDGRQAAPGDLAWINRTFTLDYDRTFPLDYDRLSDL